MGDIGNSFTNIFSMKKGKSKLPIKIIFLLLLTIVTVSAIKEASENNVELPLFENEELQVNLSEPNYSEEVLAVLEEPIFAEIIGDESIFSRGASEYFGWMDDFEELAFEDVTNRELIFNQMVVGNMEPSLEGYLINNQKYVVHLVWCYEAINSCIFKINGIPTGWVSMEGTSNLRSVGKFKVDEKLSIGINSIKFDYCGNQRFCDYHFEAQDIVNISLEINSGEEIASIGMSE